MLTSQGMFPALHVLSLTFTRSLTHSLTHSHSLAHSLSRSHSLILSLSHSPTFSHSDSQNLSRSLNRALALAHTHTLSLSPTRSLTHSLSLTHRPTYSMSFTQVSLTIPLTDSLMHANVHIHRSSSLHIVANSTACGRRGIRAREEPNARR